MHCCRTVSTGLNRVINMQNDMQSKNRMQDLFAVQIHDRINFWSPLFAMTLALIALLNVCDHWILLLDVQ